MERFLPNSENSKDKLFLFDTLMIPRDTKTESLLQVLKFEEQSWKRVKILDFNPHGPQCQIMFVDYGSTMVIDYDKYAFYSIEDVSDVLAIYPPQALQVRMALNRIPKGFAQVLREIVGIDDSVIIKVVGNNGPVPQVEFYHRSKKGLLVSVNRFLEASAAS